MTGGCPHTEDPTFDGIWCAQCTPQPTAEDPRAIAAARTLHEQQQTRLVARLERYRPQPWESLAVEVRSQMCEEAVEIVAAIDAAENTTGRITA